MDTWLKTCLILCCYGFFKELRPSEPFLTEYLLGPHHNLTDTEVYYDVYPVWTYSYLSLLVAVFLLTDLLRYKPVIIFEGFGYVFTWCLLLWAGGVRWMQLMEFCYGIATSTEVAYYTYIYAQVDARYYQRVTSFTRSAILSGRFLSGVFAQVLYSTGLMDYHSLNYFSLVSVSVALCISFFLPPVKSSIYFHREAVVDGNDPPEVVGSEVEMLKDGGSSSCCFCCSGQEKSDWFCFRLFPRFKKVSRLLWRDFKEAYSNKYILKWSVWWAFATCINYQVGNYIQPLWESISPFQESESIYNGAVEAASTLLGAGAAFGVGYLHLNWELVGELILGVISMIDALLLLYMGLSSEILVGYINYVGFRMSYQVLITVASYQVAKELRADIYGLVFGVNMFFALLFQSILTLVVVEWLEVEPGPQFVIYGCYFGILAVAFLVISLYALGSLGPQGIRRRGLWDRQGSVSERNDVPVGTTEPY